MTSSPGTEHEYLDGSGIDACAASHELLELLKDQVKAM